MKIRLSGNQFSEFSRYWLDLSKLTFASLILKLFEPGGPRFNLPSLGTMFLGLIFMFIFAMLGLQLAGRVK